MRGERSSQVVYGTLKCYVLKGACCSWRRREWTLLTRTLLTHFGLRLKNRISRRRVPKREQRWRKGDCECVLEDCSPQGWMWRMPILLLGGLLGWRDYSWTRLLLSLFPLLGCCRQWS